MKKIEIKCKAAETLPIDLITEFQGNLKKLSKKNLEKLKKRIVEDGFIAPFFVWDDRGQYKLMDGHQRLQALISLRQDGYDMPFFPVANIEAEDEADARRKLLSITSQYGEFDIEELTAWVDQIDDDIAETLRFADEELQISGVGDEEETVGDDDVQEEVEPITKFGDLWELGDHCLLCGDSTNREDVEKMMGEEMADLWLTDPPYNVSYEGGTKEALKIANDSMEDSSFNEFLTKAFGAAISFMKPGAVFYIWHADSEGFNFRSACKNVGFKVRQCLIWNKNSLVMGRQDYHWKHEPCLYGWKDGSGHLWNSDRKQTTILSFDRPSSSQEHPTMKPVPLFQYCLTNNTKELDVVLDTFGGSGTTLIASEKTNRKSRLMELDPHYCDVIVNRYKTWMEENGREFEIKLNGKVYELPNPS
jgi:DNA modification methylase